MLNFFTLRATSLRLALPNTDCMFPQYRLITDADEGYDNAMNLNLERTDKGFHIHRPHLQARCEQTLKLDITHTTISLTQRAQVLQAESNKEQCKPKHSGVF
ncbi:hypothetical protein V8G54_014151 [Vigna mungo]|uniref:Uncharacterized protein n=1 Tax=Vigna mungo TaxID=3915 RepID=A0AAQ3NII9_VIGMU